MASIDHLIVLMLENRSFDHMLGLSMSADWAIEGITGQETCDSPEGGPTVQVSGDARSSGDFNADPGHMFENVNMQIFSSQSGDVGLPPMRGFVKDYATVSHSVDEAPNIMKCFGPGRLPVLTTLAQQYAVFDHWFSSVPGPTIPNRLFAHGASSEGSVDQDAIGAPFMLHTIFEVIDKSNTFASYGVYRSDSSILALNSYLIHNGDAFRDFTQFDTDCKKDDLPSYCFIEPRYSDSADGSFPANSQHPEYAVDEGEALIASVYQSLTANQNVFIKSLLLIVYDEHGGLYDHVMPPKPVLGTGPAVTASTAPAFAFDRLGVRVPAVLVSPFIKSNTINSNQYDHCSIVATVRKLFCSDNTPFNAREAGALTFDGILNLDTARTDIVEFPAPAPVAAAGGALPLPVSGGAQDTVPEEKRPSVTAKQPRNHPPRARKPTDLVWAMTRNAEYAMKVLGLKPPVPGTHFYSAKEANDYLVKAQALLATRARRTRRRVRAKDEA